MATNTLAIGSTNVLTLARLRDTITNDFLEGATVTGTLYTEAGDPVSGAADLAMAQVDGTSGRTTLYRVEIPADVVIAPGLYTLKVTAVKSGSRRVFIEDVVAQ